MSQQIRVVPTEFLDRVAALSAAHINLSHPPPCRRELPRFRPRGRAHHNLLLHTSSGSHVLNVKCYSTTTAKELCPTGSQLSSCPFTVGRSSWHLAYFPNGGRAEHQDHISIFLVLDGTTPRTAVSADFTISLLDQAGEPVPSRSKSSHHKFADGPFDLWWAGFPDFISRETLEQSGHLSDDCFSIRCDVEVCEIRTEGQNGQPAAAGTVFSSPAAWGVEVGDDELRDLDDWWISGLAAGVMAPPIDQITMNIRQQCDH